MTKYVVAILVGVAALAGLIIFIGETSQLVLSSTSPRDFLVFELQLSWRFVVVALTVLLILLFIFWSFVGWLLRLPGQLKSGVGRRRRTQALEALEDALIAGSEGDQAKARKRAERARTLISSKALGQIVSAYAADASGDSSEAVAQYTAMLDDERTRTSGQRGLAQQLLSRGDISGAINHAGQAFEDNKKARWAFDLLFQAQLSDHRWMEAVETLSRGESRKHIDKPVARRRRAVLLSAEASRLLREGQDAAAMDSVLSAVSDAPDFAPAVALAAKLLKAAGQQKKAVGVIEKAWAQTPHPALTLALRDIYTDELTPSKAWRARVKALVKLNPDHRETTIFQVEEALRAGKAVDGWSGLSPLLADDPVSQRLCVLAAKTETLLDNPTDARVWMEKAATAPAEPDWSDLDPNGDAFNYSDRDWRRLVFSFGEDGELIHPRFEAGAARRAVLKGIAALPDPNVRDPDMRDPDMRDSGMEDSDMEGLDDAKPETSASASASEIDSDGQLSRQPDDPGAEIMRDTDDLAERLDSLLDDPSRDGAKDRP